MAQPQDHEEQIIASLLSLRAASRHCNRDLDYMLRRHTLKEMAITQEMHHSAPCHHVTSPCHVIVVDLDSVFNSSHAIPWADVGGCGCCSRANSFIKPQGKYGHNFALGLHPPQDERAPRSPAFTEELFPVNPRSLKGKSIEALPTGSAYFNQMCGFFGLGTESGFGPHLPKDDIWGIPGDAGVDLELSHPLNDIGGIRAHLVHAENHAYYNQELLLHKQWKAYIKDLKIVNSGARDSMLIQPVIALLGEAFGGAMAHALSNSSETLQIQSLVHAGILVGVGLTVAGIGLRRFKRGLSDYMMKAGAMGTALAIIVSFAGLLPPWLAWSVGAVTSILVATGLAMM